MKPTTLAPFLPIFLLLGLSACGDDGDAPAATGAADEDLGAPTASEAPTPAPAPAAEPGALPDDLPNGLLLSYSRFEANDQGQFVRPGPARLEILTREGGEWKVEVLDDPESNVFHMVRYFEPGVGDPALLSIGGTGAFVKLWRREGESWASETLWNESFGGRFDRMRDIGVADLFSEGRPSMAVATHDQGVFGILRQGDDGAWSVEKIDRRANTFVHEVEIGDLNGDGTLEVYATPSEPNTLSGAAQHGEVVRYVPREGEGRTVVADLGDRHAKEIYVGDVDGDGRDELYVAVEALMSGSGRNQQIAEPVEIRRYDAETAPDAGVVIARINDRLTRFLTVGDFDGDGKKEMVAAGFSSGLWLLRPGNDPRAEWSSERIDRNSGGFEHASLSADLDGDGTDELYVAADNQGELRRYVWVNGRPRREVIHSRESARQMMTWNLMPVPRAFVAR